MLDPFTLKRPTAVALAVAGLGAAGLLVVQTTGADAAKTQQLKLSAKSKAIKFNKTRLTAKPGKVTITFRNPKGSIAPHAVGVEGHGIDKDGKIVTAGHSAKLTVTLKKGTYDFYCPVGDHRSAGMEGKLVVK